jgi:hypothetical protein
MKTTKFYFAIVSSFICYILTMSAVHYYCKIKEVRAKISAEQRKFIQLENDLSRPHIFTAIQHRSTASAWIGRPDERKERIDKSAQ